MIEFRIPSAELLIVNSHIFYTYNPELPWLVQGPEKACSSQTQFLRYAKRQDMSPFFSVLYEVVGIYLFDFVRRYWRYAYVMLDH